MRIVEQRCGEVFFGKSNRPGLRIGNDAVSCTSRAAWMLHGNMIATRGPEGLLLSDCGWRTVTTKSRLNAILQMAGTTFRIYQQRHQWFIWDAATGKSELWDGSVLIPAAA